MDEKNTKKSQNKLYNYNGEFNNEEDEPIFTNKDCHFDKTSKFINCFLSYKFKFLLNS